jgi:hypothetical protein
MCRLDFEVEKWIELVPKSRCAGLLVGFVSKESNGTYTVTFYCDPSEIHVHLFGLDVTLLKDSAQHEATDAECLGGISIKNFLIAKGS